ncbi:hypothetical protein [Paraburkholderia tropica]|uniref:hypothetical protein n=1 Tax=Paraburkholderia tropica TaxID=92647 RepID=UPI002AB6BFD0|nr:hypothetical protein [Paraburkholderia tropica]
MDEIAELKIRVDALERALSAALKHSPDAAAAAYQALQNRIAEIAATEPPPREGFPRTIEMTPRNPRRDAEKALLARLQGLLSQP